MQVHAAHGYLISQFLSPVTNRREDRWGGDAEGRRRFLVEVVRAVRAEIGEHRSLSVKLNSADFQRGGFGEDDSLEVARVLADEGVDLLEVSGGTYSSAAMLGVDPSLKESTRRREAYFVDFAERVRREVPDLPLMLTGGFRTLGAMSEAVASGAVDVVGLGRPLTVEPHAPAGLLDGSVTSSQVRPRRSGIRTLDNLTELVHYSVQMWRMADGRDPAARPPPRPQRGAVPRPQRPRQHPLDPPGALTGPGPARPGSSAGPRSRTGTVPRVGARRPCAARRDATTRPGPARVEAVCPSGSVAVPPALLAGGAVAVGVQAVRVGSGHPHRPVDVGAVDVGREEREARRVARGARRRGRSRGAHRRRRTAGEVAGGAVGGDVGPLAGVRAVAVARVVARDGETRVDQAHPGVGRGPEVRST